MTPRLVCAVQRETHQTHHNRIWGLTPVINYGKLADKIDSHKPVCLGRAKAMDIESDRDFTSDRIKHLEMIQGVIARMANSSAWTKRLAIVIGGATTLAVRSSSHTSVLIGLAVLSLAICLFWFMDTRYHQREKFFRALFDIVREENVSERPDFRMSPSLDVRCQFGFWQSAMSWSIWPYYIVLMGVLMAVGALTVFSLFAWRVDS